MLAELDFKDLMAALGVAVTIAGYALYIRSIVAGRTRPHLFSWLVWGTLTGIAFFAQISDGAGAGALITGATSVMCGVIVAFAFFRGEKNIKRSDALALVAALAAIPVWLLTDNPLWAVILVSLIDAAGFYPTFRKSWHRPHEELAITFALSGFKFALALLALEHYSVVTVLYPASLVLSNTVFVAMLLLRRRVLPPVLA